VILKEEKARNVMHGQLGTTNPTTKNRICSGQKIKKERNTCEQ
jgi:hypothetical protein